MTARDDLRRMLDEAGHWAGPIEQKLDAYRAEVLAEAADGLAARTLLHDDCVCVAELRRMATEAGAS